MTNWVDVFPSGGNNSITISTPGTIYGRRYWGTVKVNVTGVIFRECWFVGPDPLSFGPPGTGCVQNFGSNPLPFEIWDSVIDTRPWMTIQGRTDLNPYYFGLHGGNIKLYRSEVTYTHDGWNFIGPSASPADASQNHVIQQNWFHFGLYYNDIVPPDDGQPHCDAFQFNTGRNVLIKGNTLGGQRNITGYITWPGTTVPNTFDGVGYNAGDDYWNAGLMIGQEVNTNDINRLRDITIENNWIYGGVAGINHFYDPSMPNLFENTVIRNNKFGLRGSDWGRKLRLPSGTPVPGTPPVDYTTTNPAGYYIVRHVNFASQYSGNTIEETGAAVPIQNG